VIPKHMQGIVDDFVQAEDVKPRGPNPWVGIVIHHTGITKDNSELDEAAWRRMFAGVTSWLTKKDNNYLSAHFHIGRLGEVVMLADPDQHITFHAGESSFFHPIKRKFLPYWNQYSIGIELLGDGNRTLYTNEQYKALEILSAVLVKRYRRIDPRCITGHENLTDRKADPGIGFDWRRYFAGLFDQLRRLDDGISSKLE